MTPTYLIGDKARLDLAEIWIAVAADSVVAADRLVRQFHQRFGLIDENPLIGRSRTDLGARVRVLSFGSYLIIYRPEESEVQIVRVIHRARNYPELFS